ncbi:MAG: hypothetical protein HY825_01935 [Acidobacteria bacterium]|nr:hypothetical protein [Acidobacteriota bacterium]
MVINYSRFARLLERAKDLGTDAAAKPSVKRCWVDVLSADAEAFLLANKAMVGAETRRTKERREAGDALDKLDQPYREARAVCLAHAPDQVLPETLKAAPTDTDKKDAILTLVDILDDDPQATWAKDVLEGAFGLSAAKVVTELDEARAADGQFAAAQGARAAAFGPAYEKYVRFKNVVRQAHGASSYEYRRIHLRGNGQLAVEDDGDNKGEPGKPAEPGQPGQPAAG